MESRKFTFYLGHDNDTLRAFDEDDVIRFFKRYFDGFTIIKNYGYFGEVEEGYKIEHIQTKYKQLSGIRYCKNIKKDAEEYFEQDSVLFTISRVNMFM